MIDSIDIAKLRNSEYIQFGRDFLLITHGNDETILKVNVEYAAFDSELTTIESMFKTDQSSLITAVIEALDARRDRAFLGISKNIDSYAHHFTPAMVDASVLLSDHLAIFGTASEVATSNLQSETATIRSIVTDFTTTVNLVAAITLLGLTTWVTELKTANDALAVKYLERTVEIGAANPNTIKDKRLEANAGYFELRDMINGYNTISKGAAMYTKTTSELNALIAQYNLVLTNRAATPTPPTPPVGPVA